MKNNQALSLLAYASLVLLSVGVGLLMASPAVSAHECKAEDPAKSCGECSTGYFDYENHTYNDGRVYCHNDPDMCRGGCCVGALRAVGFVSGLASDPTRLASPSRERTSFDWAGTLNFYVADCPGA